MKKIAAGWMSVLTVAYIVFAVMLLTSLSACEHEHKWEDATCTEPKKCRYCDATEGDALGHDWIEADCEHPKTCARCGKTEGEPLGHDLADPDGSGLKVCTRCGKNECEAFGHAVENWTEAKPSSCTEPGLETGVCTRCGETVERETEMKEHDAEWVIIEPATIDSSGQRAKVCRVCGKELESERYDLSPEEYEAEYKKLCKPIAYDDLQRYPGEYKGKHIKLTAVVFQIVDEASSAYSKSEYLVKSGGNYYYIKVDNYGADARILENDRITVWGEVDDLYTYYTVFMNTNTVPAIIVKYYE